MWASHCCDEKQASSAAETGSSLFSASPSLLLPPTPALCTALAPVLNQLFTGWHGKSDQRIGELIQTETNCVLSTQAHFPLLFTNQTHRIIEL